MSRTIQTPESLNQQYEFIQELGEGSQGLTWLARRLSDKRRVAGKGLKLSKAENLNSYELFVREAAVLKSLNVKGVPAFYECIHGNDDVFWLIQEYIEAPSLQTLIEQRGHFSESQTLNIMSRVADILVKLQTEYSPAVIHRDIKPSNIMCEMSEKTCHVWLIDFGAVANPQKKTGGSTIAGTFGYMPPEQHMGDVRFSPISMRSEPQPSIF